MAGEPKLVPRNAPRGALFEATSTWQTNQAKEILIYDHLCNLMMFPQKHGKTSDYCILFYSFDVYCVGFSRVWKKEEADQQVSTTWNFAPGSPGSLTTQNLPSSRLGCEARERAAMAEISESHPDWLVVSSTEQNPVDLQVKDFTANQLVWCPWTYPIGRNLTQTIVPQLMGWQWLGKLEKQDTESPQHVVLSRSGGGWHHLLWRVTS
jgi:hypothetical protein